MDGRLWDGVATELAPTHRCVMPTMPLGSHPEPMRRDADLSLRGMARIVAETIDGLGLEEVTLCFNDWSAAQVMVADGLLDRVGALVLASCETEGNYPPGLAGMAASLSAKVPGGLALMRRTLLLRRLRRLPFVYGQMSKRGVPDELMRDWLEPLARPEIRRDVRKYVGDVARGRREMEAATAALGSFERPVLVVWDSEGKMMPNELGRKLAADFPDGRLVEVDDSYTLIPIDRPQELARLIRDFDAEARGTAATGEEGSAAKIG
jgi:pimeloyl-ACP methyl ester carboxylesterase